MVDHLAQVRQLRALSGNTRPTDDLVADMLAGTNRVRDILDHARVFPLRPRTLQDLESGIVGLQRSLVELRNRVEPTTLGAA